MKGQESQTGNCSVNEEVMGCWRRAKVWDAAAYSHIHAGPMNKSPAPVPREEALGRGSMCCRVTDLSHASGLENGSLALVEQSEVNQQLASHLCPHGHTHTHGTETKQASKKG